MMSQGSYIPVISKFSVVDDDQKESSIGSSPFTIPDLSPSHQTIDIQLCSEKSRFMPVADEIRKIISLSEERCILPITKGVQELVLSIPEENATILHVPVRANESVESCTARDKNGNLNAESSNKFDKLLHEDTQKISQEKKCSSNQTDALMEVDGPSLLGYDLVPSFNDENEESNCVERRKKIRGSHSCTFPGCGKTFSRPYRLEQHNRSHTGEVSILIPLIFLNPVILTVFQYFCTIIIFI